MNISDRIKIELANSILEHSFLKKGYRFAELIKFGFECYTWWSIYYFPKVNGCSSETMRFWSYIGKAKVSLRGGSSIEKL